MDVSVTSASFIAGSPLPAQYTCDGSNANPQLSWTWMTQDTKSIAVLFEEAAGPVTHWVVWNIPPDVRGLDESAPSSGVAGTNDFDHVGYDGPCPTPGNTHNYRFVVYGLDTMLTIPQSATRETFDHATSVHVVAKGVMRTTYERAQPGLR
jgi:Raf kinase inhibitor-like YbhB/YbcL family protein